MTGSGVRLQPCKCSKVFKSERQNGYLVFINDAWQDFHLGFPFFRQELFTPEGNNKFLYRFDTHIDLSVVIGEELSHIGF